MLLPHSHHGRSWPSTFPVNSGTNISASPNQYLDYGEDNDTDIDGSSVLPASQPRKRSRRPQHITDDAQGSPDSPGPGVLKRSKDNFESFCNKDVSKALSTGGAVAAIMYHSGALDPQANDVWPNFRNSVKLPARYYLLDKDTQDSRKARRPRHVREPRPKHRATAPITTVGRPVWNLPVELVELIASYLNRDDIKSMRLVSRELNYNVAQVLFKTVVVPFNTEIYGMLGNEPKPDHKGKKKAKIDVPAYTWNNSNSDSVYKGHGLDVFRGFGCHIQRFGMSFEVNEDTLANPPKKVLTERHQAFWGCYDWPFEEYRRFEHVAGLETTADETPRMKIAFSELSKVRELALSIDSGLGWLNGPDRSIRARILQRPPEVFGSLKQIPDRRAQAQQELWEYLETCHRVALTDIKTSTLYRLDSNRLELDGANLAVDRQPDMPFLDPQIIRQAVPHDTITIPMTASFDDPEIFDRLVSMPALPASGILFSSGLPPSEFGQLMNPINPATLTKSQMEWLLETEWAQRAFLSSYMLSVIDNAPTFSAVHSLNIARLSDRYLPMLHRIDFWNSLPNLTDVTLFVIPSWRGVHKDEAGVVNTPKINPDSAIEPFYLLLNNVISLYRNISKLTIGWTTGGEHAEGVHARNKLILPAPLLGYDTVAADNAEALSVALVQLPFVKHLTLKNCWVSPPALLQFVKAHDHLTLEHLVLNSVSLTATHSLLQNNQQPAVNAQIQNVLPANVAVFNPATGTFIPPNGQGQIGQNQLVQFFIPRLQHILQQMQTQAQASGTSLLNHPQVATLQNQLLHQLHLQNPPVSNQSQILGYSAANIQNAQSQAASMVVTQAIHQHHVQAIQTLPVAQQPSFLSQASIDEQPRDGSWASVIDIITPGPNLSDLGSTFSKADPDRITSLRSIEFISCGYARLPNTQIEQADLDANRRGAYPDRDPYFRRRFNTLAPAMLSTKWRLLGEIVQDVKPEELEVLDAGWNLKTGWENEEEARAVEFDGLLLGGTGRFTGILRAEDRMAQLSVS